MAGAAALLAGVGSVPAHAMTLAPGWQIATRPGSQTIDLPAGALRVEFVAIGGSGGGPRGGRAAVVQGAADVGAWKQLDLRVGAAGGFSVNGTAEGVVLPGQGGRASWVRLCDAAARRCAPVAIAAGGGGSSAGTSAFRVAAGGDAGAAGENGVATPGALTHGLGGGAGTQTAGGAGGAGGSAPGDCVAGDAGPAGDKGTALFGGDGGFKNRIAPGRIGGDGGEGYYGGGGGGGGAGCGFDEAGGAAGGGGGSSLVPAGGTVTLDDHLLMPGPSVRWFVEIERAAPTVTISSPADGASYRLGQVLRASFDCADEAGGAGIAECTGTVAREVSVDTASAGSKSFTVTARDRAGNVTTKTVSYTVVAPDVTVRGLIASARAIQFTLSTPAGVSLRIERRKPGRRVRWSHVGTLRASGRSGFNTIRFNGKVGKRRLAAGSYRVTVTAAADGRRSRPLTKAFTVRAAPRGRARGRDKRR